MSIMIGARSWLLLAIATACLAGCDDDGTLPDPGAVAQAAVAQDALPGVATIVLDGKRVRYGVAGLRQVGDPDDLTLGIFDRFAIGSITKSMTATLAGILVQEGIVSWNSRLYDVLPELATAGHGAYGHVTLRDLLTHSSGVYAAATPEQITAVPAFDGSPRQQRLQFSLWAITEAPAILPGSQFEYSNGGYVAAAAMLERLTNQDFEELMHAKLFKPLHIEPQFVVPAARLDREQPWPHLRDPNTGLWQALDPADELLRFPAVGNPAGGVSLRLHEFAAYLRMHLQALQGRTGLPITPETAKVLHTEVLALQAIGWVKTFDDKGRPISFSAGSDEYSMYAMVGISAEQGRAAAVLGNGYDVETENHLAIALTRLFD